MIDHATGASLMKADPAGWTSLCDQTEETHAHPCACFACFAAAAAVGGAVDAAVGLGDDSAEHGQSLLLLLAWATALAGPAACSPAQSSPWAEGVGWGCFGPGASEQQ